MDWDAQVLGLSPVLSEATCGSRSGGCVRVRSRSKPRDRYRRPGEYAAKVLSKPGPAAPSL